MVSMVQLEMKAVFLYDYPMYVYFLVYTFAERERALSAIFWRLVPPPTIRFVNSPHNLIHRHHGSESHTSLHHRVWDQAISYGRIICWRNLPNASLHFSNGYFSTMQLMFCNSVNSIASSESIVCPLGQEYTESPYRI